MVILIKKVLLFLIFCSSIFVTTNARADGIGFDVKIIQPDNQLNKEATYFDLSIVPNQEQILEVLINNEQEEDKEIDYQLTNAWTTMFGSIDYSPYRGKVDSSMKFPMEKLIIPESSSVVVPGKSQKKIALKMSIPPTINKGLFLGGIHFTQRNGDNTEKDNKSTVVSNKIAIVKGIQLSYGELPEKVLKIAKPSVFKFQHKPVVTINYQNASSAIISGMKVKTKIVDAKTGGKILEDEKQNIQMAPNSNFDLPTNWDQDEIPVGTYKAIIEAEVDGKTWQKTLGFQVDNQTKKQTRADPSEASKENPNHTLLYVVIGLVAFILLSGSYLTLKTLKNRKEEKK